MTTRSDGYGSQVADDTIPVAARTVSTPPLSVTLQVFFKDIVLGPLNNCMEFLVFVSITYKLSLKPEV